MSQSPSRPKLMILDACVLIDFIKVERAILELVVKNVGLLYVTSPVVDEVREVENGSELIDLGIVIIDPDIEDAFTAGGKSGSLSFEDWLCLLTAKRHGFICVTNDKNLRRHCEADGVSLLWGLELVAALHKTGGITGKEAATFAKGIRKTNPKHITEKILTQFLEVIRKQDGRGP